jgi:Ca2+-transporting ATPase
MFTSPQSGDKAIKSAVTQRVNTPHPSIPWYNQEVDQVLAGTGAVTGLSRQEAKSRLADYGPNELVERGSRRPGQILWEQLTAVMVVILLAASALSFFLGKYLEAGAILAIVILFVTLGFLQEYRAEKAIAALKKLAVPAVRVYREGKLVEIGAPMLVPGDIVVLEAGNLVPADVRIIESVNLQIQEAALTGESQPVEKTVEALTSANLSLGERRNMGYMGTLVTYGRGSGLVVETGMRTELGKIADMLQALKPDITPLQQQLDRVGKQLALAGLVCALLIIFLGISAGEALTDMILSGISLAVAVIPEGLPAVVTVTLALGAQRMLRRNALIRKLPAVETLGSVTTICSDKTGTLTQNKMSVTIIDVAGQRFDFTGSLSEKAPDPKMGEVEPQLLANQPAAVTMVLAGGALCNNARLQMGEERQAEILGEPTEAALIAAGNQAGINVKILAQSMPRVGELPFDSVRKRMTTLHKRPVNLVGSGATRLQAWSLGGLEPQLPFIALTKGSVDGLLEISQSVWDGQQVGPLKGDQLERILAVSNQLACDGMRVLGLAFKFYDQPTLKLADEANLVFFGLVGMIDPPRREVKQAVQECITAGIRPILITGDHPLTAGYIAREVGINSPGGRVVSGAELDQLSQAELEKTVVEVSVFARVVPEHKLKIVEALQNRGQVVAMTGDGVNDAPALKKADIGVAMGVTGTDVSKEAADMVLRDDNFATIVAAVEEGRVIYDNLRRFIGFAVAGNIGKVIIMLLWPLPFYALGLALQDNIALLPLQLLWLNLMTDGLLGLSMGFEQAEKNVMHRPPRSPKEGIFTGGLGWQVVGVGIFIGLIGLGVGFFYYRAGLPYWQSMVFTTAAFLQVFQALATRSSSESLFSMGVFSNRWMWYIIGLVSLGQGLAIYTPLATFFGLKPLPLFDFGLSIALGSCLLMVVELE